MTSQEATQASQRQAAIRAPALRSCQARSQTRCMARLKAVADSRAISAPTTPTVSRRSPPWDW
jgi:hypothetical protein